MNATINGEGKDLDEGTTVGGLLRALGVPLSGIAVAVNERIVRAVSFDDHQVRDGDSIEIIRAVAGG